MATVSDVFYDGVLDADGTIRLDHPPEVRPGPVRIALRPVPKSGNRDLLLPDASWPDDSILPPCDLPLPGQFEAVRLIEVHDVLPDPFLDVNEIAG